MKTIQKVISGVLVVVVLGLAAVSCSTEEGPTKIADGFLAAAREGDMPKAYSYLSEDFQKIASQADLAAFMERQGLTDFESASWTSPSIDGDQGVLNGTLSRKSGGAVPLTLELVKGGQGWKINALEKPDTGGEAEAPSPGTLSGDDLIRLVRQSTLAFAQAVNAKSMSGLYQTISDTWRSQTSPEALDGFFKGFYDSGLDLTLLANMNPVFDVAPSLGGDGVLEVSGHYPTSPSRVYFHYRYVYEGPDWKLLGLTVNVK